MGDTVFIAHRGSDEAAAASLAAYLGEHGFEVRVDRELFADWSAKRTKGSSFNRALDEELAACDAFVVFAGPELSRWQEQEVGAALRREWDSDDFRIVPVSRPDEPLPGALAFHQAVIMDPDDGDEGWRHEVVQVLTADAAEEPEADLKSWSQQKKSDYKQRLEKITEMAKDDEARRLEASDDLLSPWST